MKDNKIVLIGMPNGSGQVPATMVQSLLQLHKPCPCAFMIVERQRVDKVRNYMALQAIKNGASHLLFVDDDNPIPEDTLELMLQDDKDIVVAPILSRNPNGNGKHDLCSFYAKSHKVTLNDQEIDLRLYSPIEVFKDKGPLHKIDAGGTGCMLIKVEVLKAMYKKYGETMFEFGDLHFDKTEINGVVYDRRTMSEDCEFCERAVDLGFEVWLDERIRPHHISGYRVVQWNN